MLFQKGSYLRLGQLFSLAAILIAVIIDGLLVTTKFTRPKSHSKKAHRKADCNYVGSWTGEFGGNQEPVNNDRDKDRGQGQ